MMQQELEVNRLLACGFREAGVWTIEEQRLTSPAGLPALRGVYAFAVEDTVMYVGLASRSIKQRLGGYCRPGPSQRTNQRLNGVIRDCLGSGGTVRILIAHPKDGAWSELRISGPEGLEAALIEDFDLPWNVRGSGAQTPSRPDEAPLAPSVSRRAPTIAEAILDFVAANPRCTELQIAKGTFGPAGVQPRVNLSCRKLVEKGLLERLPTRPAVYLVKT